MQTWSSERSTRSAPGASPRYTARWYTVPPSMAHSAGQVDEALGSVFRGRQLSKNSLDERGSFTECSEIQTPSQIRKLKPIVRGTHSPRVGESRSSFDSDSPRTLGVDTPRAPGVDSIDSIDSSYIPEGLLRELSELRAKLGLANLPDPSTADEAREIISAVLHFTAGGSRPQRHEKFRDVEGEIRELGLKGSRALGYLLICEFDSLTSAFEWMSTALATSRA